MSITNPLTELDAVNILLQTIGESPVNSLTDGSVTDAVIAQQVLEETSIAVQSEGWNFNTEKNYPLTPDINGVITLPLTFMRVELDTDNDSGFDLVQRGQSLYDRKGRTNLFTRTIKCEVVLLLAFSDLPPSARRYITIKAARLFQSRMVGSETLGAFTEQEEKAARSALEEHEGDTAGYSIFDNYSVARSVDRNRGVTE